MTLALAAVAAFVRRESGIHLAEHQYPFLQAALDRIGAGSPPDAFLRRVSDPRERRQLVTQLIDEVTVKETSFLRDRGQLASIDWPRLLENAHARGADRVRVWTAPCATGEEAYSLALLACEAFGTPRPPVSILATDIAVAALVRARLGVYGPRSARALGPADRARYFRADDCGLVVGGPLRALVTFARHNLISDPFPPLGEKPFDLILCRNVLIYFDGETVGRVLASLQDALARSGELVLGVADELCASASRRAPAAADAVAPCAPDGQLRRPLGRLRAPAAAPVDEVAAADHFHRGLTHLQDEDPAAAVTSLRRALYIEPGFGLAAFKLGGAYEALGEPAAAQRAYEQALRALEPHERHEPFLAQIDLADVATAARARLDVLIARLPAAPRALARAAGRPGARAPRSALPGA
jgi:chemotaxis protein methyltransferase CheR